MAWRTSPVLVQATFRFAVVGNVRFEAVMVITVQISGFLLKGTNCLINMTSVRNAYII